MIYPFKKKWPEIHETAFIAPSADVVGEVRIGSDSSIWFQCVVRGDVNWIEIGARTNVQDHSMLHVDRRDCPLRVGNDVTIGHRVMLHGCTIGDRVLVGMGAIVMNRAVVGDDCIIGAGALVTEDMQIPSGSLVLGMPAKVKRQLNEKELAYLKKSAENYVGDSRDYRAVIPGAKRFGVNEEELNDLGEFGDFTGTRGNGSKESDEDGEF